MQRWCAVASLLRRQQPPQRCFFFVAAACVPRSRRADDPPERAVPSGSSGAAARLKPATSAHATQRTLRWRQSAAKGVVIGDVRRGPAGRVQDVTAERTAGQKTIRPANRVTCTACARRTRHRTHPCCAHTHAVLLLLMLLLLFPPAPNPTGACGAVRPCSALLRPVFLKCAVNHLFNRVIDERKGGDYG